MGQYGSASHPGREVSNSKDSDLVKAMKAGISSLLLAGGNWYRVWLIGGSWGGWERVGCEHKVCVWIWMHKQ